MIQTNVGSHILQKANLFKDSNIRRPVQEEEEGENLLESSCAKDLLSDEAKSQRCNSQSLRKSIVSPRFANKGKKVEEDKARSKKTKNQSDNSQRYSKSNPKSILSMSSVEVSEDSQQDNLISKAPSKYTTAKPVSPREQKNKSPVHSPVMQTNRKSSNQELPKAKVFESQYTTMKRSPSPLAGKSFLKNGSVLERPKLSPKMLSHVSIVPKVNKNLLISTNSIVKRPEELDISELDPYAELLTARANKLVSRSDSIALSANLAKLANPSKGEVTEFNASQQGLKDQDLLALCIKSKALFSRSHVNLANNALTIDGLSVFLFYAAQNSIQAGSLDLRRNKINERAVELISVFLSRYPNLISDIDLRENGIQRDGLGDKLKVIERNSGTTILI